MENLFNIKNLFTLLTLFYITSCMNSGDKNKLNEKKIVCDSLTESWLDSTGVEKTKTTYVCDTLEENK